MASVVRDADPPPSPGARVTLSAQLIFLVAYLFGSFGILLAAALHQDDLAVVFDPRLERLGDPKDSPPVIGPDSVWNPLAWVFGIARIVAFMIYPLAVLMLPLGVLGPLRTRYLGDRKTFHLITVTTTIWLALAVLAVTPYGGHLLTWLLD